MAESKVENDNELHKLHKFAVINQPELSNPLTTKISCLVWNGRLLVRFQPARAEERKRKAINFSEQTFDMFQDFHTHTHTQTHNN